MSHRLRRVAVVGLMPDQAKKVARRLGSHFDLRFLPASRRPGFPGGCARVVLMTKFIGHDWQWAAYAQFSRECVHRHHGGTSTLIDFLTQWLAE
jgi:hypothetical protein